MYTIIFNWKQKNNTARSNFPKKIKIKNLSSTNLYKHDANPFHTVATNREVRSIMEKQKVYYSQR